MKKTINVNIGLSSFTLDDDAYNLLKTYLRDIRSRLNIGEANEIMNDIEVRIADILKENTSFNSQVVTIEMVRRAIGIIGHADDFGEAKSYTSSEPSIGDMNVRKLYRSRNERVIAGVCGGLAQYFGLDVTLLRVLTFVFTIFGGMSLWVYIILWIVVPQQPINSNYFNK